MEQKDDGPATSLSPPRLLRQATEVAPAIQGTSRYEREVPPDWTPLSEDEDSYWTEEDVPTDEEELEAQTEEALAGLRTEEV